MIKGRYRIIGTRNGQVVYSTGWIDNLVMLSDTYGLNLLIRALGNNTTYGVNIIKAKMGTGSTAPADADTDLQTPVVDDILIATTDFPSASEVVFKFFAPDADVPNNTYTEFGLFAGDGSSPITPAKLAAARIFARSLIVGTYVKAAGVDTTVEYSLQAFNT